MTTQTASRPQQRTTKGRYRLAVKWAGGKVTVHHFETAELREAASYECMNDPTVRGANLQVLPGEGAGQDQAAVDALTRQWIAAVQRVTEPAPAAPAGTHTADLEARNGAAMITVAPLKRGPYTEHRFTPQGDPRAEAEAVLAAAGWQLVGEWKNLGGGWSRVTVRVKVDRDRDPDRLTLTEPQHAPDTTVTVNPTTPTVTVTDPAGSTLTLTPGDVVTLTGIPGRSTGRHTDLTVTEVDRDPDGTVTVRYVGPGGYRDTLTADLDAFTVTLTGRGSTRCACPPEVKVSGHWPSCRLGTLTLDECRTALRLPVRRIQVLAETPCDNGDWVVVDDFTTATYAHTADEYATIADGYATTNVRDWGRVRVSVWCPCCLTAGHAERERVGFPASWIPAPPAPRGAQALAA